MIFVLVKDMEQDIFGKTELNWIHNVEQEGLELAWYIETGWVRIKRQADEGGEVKKNMTS